MADLAHAKEDDIDLHGDFDAAHWAERFVARVRENPSIAASEGAMCAWFAGALMTGYDRAQIEATPGGPGRLAEMAEHEARGNRLADQHGEPGHIEASGALALARTSLVPVAADVTADDIYASIYRDSAAAEAWMQSNWVHNGHPALACVPLPDGRVVGIMDMRPALKRAREES